MKKLVLAMTAIMGLFALTVNAEASVLRVVVVETSDVSAYMSTIAKIRAATKRLGSNATIRAWRARYAGPDAGTIVVSIESPDLATFVADTAKFETDAEYASLIKGLDSLRTIVSDSLYDELK